MAPYLILHGFHVGQGEHAEAAQVIKSFGDEVTEVLFRGPQNARERKLIARFPSEVRRRARAKLLMLDAASRLTDLKIPPSNRLEALSGNLDGFFSIRVNEQWRIIFRWINNDAYDVEFTDYH